MNSIENIVNCKVAYFSRSTTFILIVSTFETVYKI
jgi:hypothetical protein